MRDGAVRLVVLVFLVGCGPRLAAHKEAVLGSLDQRQVLTDYKVKVRADQDARRAQGKDPAERDALLKAYRKGRDHALLLLKSSDKVTQALIKALLQEQP
jgi:hypothetical protein